MGREAVAMFVFRGKGFADDEGFRFFGFETVLMGFHGMTSQWPLRFVPMR